MTVSIDNGATPGTIYLAPADYHLLVEKGRFNLSVDDAVHHSRPSVDVLFESAADAYGPRVIGIVLTGSNADGARGALQIKRRGGLVVAPEMQDCRTAGFFFRDLADLGAVVS